MDLVAISETWLNIGEKGNKVIKDLTPADYKFVHLPRKSRRGGGVGLVYRSSFNRFAIVGDFNIHWDVPSDNNVKHFADLLESLNIIQHVQTHIDGHTIDLILTPSITSTKTTLLPSDHLWVECLVDNEKPVVPRKTITYRKYKAINKPAFCSDIASSLPTAISSGKQTTTALANHYNVVLTKPIEKHAPPQTCRIADRPLVPWYNKKVIKANTIRRQWEMASHITSSTSWNI